MKMRRRGGGRRRSSIYTHSKRSFEHKLNVGRLTTRMEGGGMVSMRDEEKAKAQKGGG
jgi:hypothetical protein